MRVWDEDGGPGESKIIVTPPDDPFGDDLGINRQATGENLTLDLTRGDPGATRIHGVIATAADQKEAHLQQQD